MPNCQQTLQTHCIFKHDDLDMIFHTQLIRPPDPLKVSVSLMIMDHERTGFSLWTRMISCNPAIGVVCLLKRSRARLASGQIFSKSVAYMQPGRATVMEISECC